MPDIFTSISVAILPIILIAGAENYAMVSTAENTLSRFIGLIGSPELALLITLFVAIIVFGPMRGTLMSKLAISMAESAKGMAMIIMVIGAGGSFKDVLVATGTADYIADMTGGWDLNPIILVWLSAVILRIALGDRKSTRMH